MKKAVIITFGEIVWDRFGDVAVLGGAPLNVTYHLTKQQWPALLISRIGNDPLGRQTLTRIRELGVETGGIQADPELPTGTVNVTFSAEGEPLFEITNPAAWDAIAAAEIAPIADDAPYHLVFGTLAQRHATSRSALRSLWNKADTVFYDVNLRPPFTPLPHVVESLAAADIVKMNHTELSLLGGQLTSRTRPEEIARSLLETFDLTLLAVTEGADGAWLCNRDVVVRHPGFPVKVADAVGSGDAFLSRLVIGVLQGIPLAQCLEDANRLGSFVASCQGATPAY